MTIREDIRANYKAAMEYIDPAHDNAPVGTRAFLTTLTTVRDRLETPEQVEDVDRPFIGFRFSNFVPGPKAFFETRDQHYIDTYIYPELDLDDGSDSPDATRAQLDEMIADVIAAVYLACYRRLWDPVTFEPSVTFIEVDDVDDDDGAFMERGYSMIRVRIVEHHSVGVA